MFYDYKHNLKNFILIAFALTIVKIAFLYFSKFPLWVDEAQYWFWSKFLEAGYYSKPPAIAWIIHSTTNFLGDKEFYVRLASPFLHLLTAIYIYQIAYKLYDEKIANYSGLIYLLMPAVLLSSNFISADAPLMLCWAGAIYHLIIAMEYKDESRFFSWLLFAIWLGLGFLSKYTTIILVGGLFIYVLFARFSHFFSVNFWFSLIFAGLIFLPNFLWNYNNDFVSFLHTQENLLNTKASESFFEKFSSLNFKGFLEFVFSQIAVFGLLAFFIFNALYQKVKTDILLIAEEREARFLLFWVSVPTLIAGLLLSLFASAQAHWSAPAYIGISILIAWYLVRKNMDFFLKLWLT
ncbi:MAG: glycosyltransferase family 39 protein, partial [Rickettsiales bacterium]|nr:glycosyltransferase family 39 protein [Rickettsiales bacterium]